MRSSISIPFLRYATCKTVISIHSIILYFLLPCTAEHVHWPVLFMSVQAWAPDLNRDEPWLGMQWSGVGLPRPFPVSLYGPKCTTMTGRSVSQRPVGISVASKTDAVATKSSCNSINNPAVFLFPPSFPNFSSTGAHVGVVSGPHIYFA